MATGAVEREHELCGEALVQWVAANGGFELADDEQMAVGVEFVVESALERGEAEFFQTDDFGRGEGVEGEVGERGATPQRERVGVAAAVEEGAGVVGVQFRGAELRSV